MVIGFTIYGLYNTNDEITKTAYVNANKDKHLWQHLLAYIINAEA